VVKQGWATEIFMKRYAVTYLCTALIFAAVDSVWIGLFASKMYRRTLGPLVLDQFRAAPAIAFYLLLIAGIMVFVIPKTGSPQSVAQTALFGALFGACFSARLCRLRMRFGSLLRPRGGGSRLRPLRRDMIRRARRRGTPGRHDASAAEHRRASRRGYRRMTVVCRGEQCPVL